MMTYSVACTLVALVVCLDLKDAKATLTSSPTSTVACPNDTVTFTCTVPSTTTVSIRWTVAPPPGLNVVSATGAVGNNVQVLDIGTDGFMFLANYSGLDGGMVTSTLTTRTKVTALAGAMVQCEAIGGTGGGGPIPISVADPPSPPLNPRVSSTLNQPSSSTITLEWDPPSSTGGVSVRYVLTISPTPLSGSPLTVETTSAQINVSHNTPYNVTIKADNCAGMSNDSMFTIPSIVACPSSLSAANGVVNIQTPSVPTVGSTLTFTCSEDNQMETSTCGNDGQWNPDPENFMCPTMQPPVTCPVPGAPSMGNVSNSSQSYTEGSQVTYQCNEGLFPMGVLTATCTRDGQNGVWERDPSTVVCSTSPVNCSLPAEPSNGTIVGYDMLMMNETVLEGTMLTYQCDNGLSLTGPNTITCTNAGVWSTEPGEIMCVPPTTNPTPTSTGDSIGPIVGGAVGGVLVLVCLIAIVVIVLLLLRRQKSDEFKEDEVEMSGFQGDYSELRHDGPRGKAQPPPPDSEGYSRINRNQDAGALAYDEVVINSDNKIGVNSEGYSTMNAGEAQRLPGYGQLGNVATVEPVVYAALSSSQPRKKGNTTATVDQHQVTYATVDVSATKKQEAKAATLPASSTGSGSGSGDVDKLLDIDQALVQIRSMKHKWRELAETVRVPETMIQQIEESCRNDSAGCLTEVIDQWMRGCSGRPTWRELANQLRKIGEEELAQQLMTIYDTGRLPVEVNMKAVPSTVYKYDRAPPPPLPSRSPTMTDDSSGKSQTLPPSRPPKSTGETVPVRPPKPVPRDETPAAPPRPPKHYAKH